MAKLDVQRHQNELNLQQPSNQVDSRKMSSELI